jgi:hypothetical protein
MRCLRPLALVLTLLALGAPLAFAAQQTREGYVEAVEPICERNTKANEKILAGVEAEIRAAKLKQAAAQLGQAARALKQTLAELRAVPRPPADAARLTRWFADIGGEVKLFEAAARKLAAGDRTGAERMSARLSRQANVANDEVLAFGFRYCRAEPSKFL